MHIHANSRSTSAEADGEVEDQPGKLEPAASADGVSRLRHCCFNGFCGGGPTKLSSAKLTLHAGIHDGRT